MSAKKPPPTDENVDDPFEYVQKEDYGDDDDDGDGKPAHHTRLDDDDDDDDEEDELIPDGEDDDEDDEDYEEDELIPDGEDDHDEEDDRRGSDNQEDEVVPLFDGTLSLDKENLLHYRGETFHLVSNEALEWNLLDPSRKSSPDQPSMYTLEMEGSCDIEIGNGKPTHRKIEVTFSLLQDRDSVGNGALLIHPSEHRINQTVECESEKKMPSIVYNVQGRQVDTSRGEILEFQGLFTPSRGEINHLVCRVRVLPSLPIPVAAVAKLTPTAAAKVDDEDDDEAGGDDEVGYDELIALHEEAGLPVPDLEKSTDKGT